MSVFIWIVGLLTIPVLLAVLARVAMEMYAEQQLRSRVASTRRVETIDGHEYVVVTWPLQVLRERRTGRMGLLLERGLRNMPTTIDGRTVLEPMWVKVQFIRKSDGQAGRVEWRDYSKFERVGTAEVEFLTKRIGWFQTELRMRYPADLAR